jgi:ABC-type uncharacterized transport system auxiliary subunit
MKAIASHERSLGRRSLLGAGLLGLLNGCVSVDVGSEAAKQRIFVLHDPGSVQRRAQPLVPALLLQPAPGGAVADTLAIAYSQRANELAFYQLATWNERPVRQVPQLLQQRLEARGLAAATGLVGDPLAADWLLTVRVDRLEHEIINPPGQAQVQLTFELFDRRQPGRVGRQQFSAQNPVASADSAAAAQAMSEALGRTFDDVLPWLEGLLQTAAPAQGQSTNR